MKVIHGFLRAFVPHVFTEVMYLAIEIVTLAMHCRILLIAKVWWNNSKCLELLRHTFVVFRINGWIAQELDLMC